MQGVQHSLVEVGLVQDPCCREILHLALKAGVQHGGPCENHSRLEGRPTRQHSMHMPRSGDREHSFEKPQVEMQEGCLLRTLSCKILDTPREHSTDTMLALWCKSVCALEDYRLGARQRWAPVIDAGLVPSVLRLVRRSAVTQPGEPGAIPRAGSRGSCRLPGLHSCPF